MIQQPRVQTYVVHKVSEYLSKQFGSEVKVDSVNIKFIRTLEIYHVYVSTQKNKKDTLLYVNKLNVDLMIGQTLMDQIRHLKNTKINDKSKKKKFVTVQIVLILIIVLIIIIIILIITKRY